MDPYGTAHLVALTLFVLGIWPVVALGRRQRETSGVSRASRGFAVLIVAFALPTQVADILTRFEIGVSLPLHLSDLAWMAAAAALWTHHRYPVALTYFWGLVLTTQAIVTPSLGEDFPELRFFAFWGLHLSVVWAAIFLVWGCGLTPRWRDYGTTLATTLVWAVVAYSFNEVAGTNYGYLQRKPSSGSILDYLGPWPVYVLAEIAIVAVLWALMTWPWVRRAAPTRV